jgi:hypothetical protein
MYGNPVEENKHYKLMLIFCCPNAHQIDFSTVTARQKGMVSVCDSQVYIISIIVPYLPLAVCIGGVVELGASQEIIS